MMFAVIGFTSTNEVEVVPESWIVKSGESFTSWWPNVRNTDTIKALIKKQAKPNPKEYLMWPVRIFATYDSYNKARKNLTTFQYQSEPPTTTDEDEKKKSRKRRANKRNSHSNDLDVVQAKMPFLEEVRPSPSPHSAINTSSESDILSSYTPLSSSEEEKDEQEHAQIPPATRPVSAPFDEAGPSGLQTGASPIGNRNIDVTTPQRNPYQSENLTPVRSHVGGSEFEKWTVRNLNVIKTQLKQLQESVDSVLLNLGQEGRPINPQPATTQHAALPNLKSLGDFEHFSSEVYPIQKDAIMEQLALRGGKSLGSATRRILASIMKDDLAAKFSWIGSRGGKEKFSGSILWKLLKGSLRLIPKYKQSTEAEIEAFVKEWLKNASKRIKAAEKGTEANQHV